MWCPKTSTHNPTHTYLTSPHQRRSNSQRGEIFSLRRENHFEPKRITKPAPRNRLFWRSSTPLLKTGGGLLIHPALFVLTSIHLFSAV